MMTSSRTTLLPCVQPSLGAEALGFWAEALGFWAEALGFWAEALGS
jgi:hypothetical protein